MLCGCAEQLGNGSISLKLQTNRPLVFIQDQLPSYTRDQIWEWMSEAHARWSAVCDWQVRRIHDLAEAGPNDYVQTVYVADLGGDGILADQRLPYNGGRRLPMRLNERIRWVPTNGNFQNGTIDPIRTI